MIVEFATAFCLGICAGGLSVAIAAPQRSRWNARAFEGCRAGAAPASSVLSGYEAGATVPEKTGVACQVISDVTPTPPAQTAPVSPAARCRRDVVPLRSAKEHARALLEFLQGPGGLVGEITANEIAASYGDLMFELQWVPRPWASVAAALRAELGASKTYAYRAGTRVRVWRIPAASTAQPELRQAA